MDCSEVQARFVDYIDGDLSEEDGLSVELHVAECYACREELDELGKILELCGAALEHPCPTNRFEKLQERLASAEQQYDFVAPRRKLRVRELLVKLAVAAVIIGLIGASPFLVKRAKRLFAPLEQPAVLGNGGDLERLRLPLKLRLTGRKRAMEEQADRTESEEEEGSR